MSTILDRIRSEKVEWKKLGEVCEILKGTQFNKKEMLETGKYPVINGGIFPSGYIDIYNQEENKITISEGGASAGYVNYIQTKFWLGGHAYAIIPRDILLNKYLYYYLKRIEHKIKESKEGAGIPSVKKSKLINFEIPIPSLETQEKIVEILDKFTKYVTELQAELQFRIQQYEYYRDMTLSEKWLLKETEKLNRYIKLLLNGKEFSEEEKEFVEKQCKYYKDKILNDFAKLEWKTVGEVYERLRGTPITAGKMKEIENKKGEIKIFAGGKTEVNAFEKDIENANIVRTPAVLVQSRGNIDVIYCENPFTFKNEMWAYTHKDKVYVKYLYYYFQANIKRFRDKASAMGSFPQISVEDTEKFKIALPSKAIQNKVVEILDKFEEMLNNTKGLLPHEIELRRKQYEYYREKLLTFEAKYDKDSRFKIQDSRFKIQDSSI